VKLDQFLGTLSVDQLQDLAVVWAPNEPASNSKLALFRVLRERMTRPERARHCLELAEPFGRSIVRKLLRSENVSQSVAALAASSASRPKSIDETRAAVAELASLGLASLEPERRWEAYGSALVTIPDELIEPLRKATGIDDRPWAEVLNLADHLGALSARELAQRLRKLGLAAKTDAPFDELVAALTTAEACSERLAALSAELRGLVLAAVHSHGGIVPVAQLAELAPPGADLGDATLASWRKELEAQLIGTVGDVSLLEYGIDLDGKAMVVFTEVTESLLLLPCEAEIKVADPVGPDFLLDLCELLSSVRESGAKLKASGALTGAAAQRILAKLNRPSLPLAGSAELLELHVICAEKLGLVERSNDSLTASRGAWAWEGGSCERKAADLFRLVGSAVPAPRSKHHHEGLCEAARALIRSMRPGEWRPGGSLEHVTLRRYLAALKSTSLREEIAQAVQQVSRYVLPPFPGLRQLAADLRESVVMEAYAMGIVDLAAEGDRVTAVRLSEFGALAAGVEGTPQRPARLIGTPDFEVIILPEGDTTRLRYEVGQFAVREKFEQTYHLRITKERVEEAVVRGLTAEAMTTLLREHAESGTIPQNVEYSIRGWAERVRVATVEAVHVFELPDEQTLNVVAELPGLKPLVVRRISPTALALREWPADRELLADLAQLGVYVR